MKMHLYDLVSTFIVDPKEEALKIFWLLSSEEFFFGHRLTLEKFIDEKIFRGLSFRGTFISVSDLRSALGIAEADFSLNNPLIEVPIEKLFLLSELLLGIYEEGKQEIERCTQAEQLMKTIISNIKTIVDKTNHELHNICAVKYRPPQYIIVEKNKLVSEAVSLIEDKNLSLAVIEYNHYVLRGKMTEKRNILSLLANHVEPMLNDKTLRDGGYSNLQSDVRFLVNNFQIRHNNKEGKNKRDYILSLSDKDLEMWYDRAYSLMLELIVGNENCKIHADITELKSKYKWT